MTSASFVVRAPATSANLGAGFDCIGLALDLWNEVHVQLESPGTDPDNLILRAARRVYEEVGAQPVPGFMLRCVNRVPFGRGLGSSSAAIACGVLLANHGLGGPLGMPDLLRLATIIEGHPDNVVPALLGGAQVTTRDDAGDVLQAAIPLALELRAVAFVPEHAVPTAHARSLLPPSVPRADALFNVARASLLVAALATGRKDLLAEATRDRLHQPYRLPLFPAGATLLEGALQAGALAAYTSGAGPTVLALCEANQPAAEQAIAAAFESIAQRLGLGGVCLRLDLSPRGAYIAD